MPEKTRRLLLFAASAAFLIAVNAAAYWALAAARLHWHDPGIPFSLKGPILIMVSAFLLATAVTDLLLFLNERTVSEGGSAFLAVVIGCSIALFALAMTSQPSGSADNYWNVLMSRGWVLHGNDPYLSTPNDIAGDPLFGLIAHAWRSSSMVYGPVWTLLAALPVAIFHGVGSQLMGMKLLTSVGYAAAGFLLYWRFKRRDPAAANMLLAAWLLNPIAIFEVANGAHNEGVLVLAMAVFAVGLIERRPDWAVPGLMAGVLIKVWPIVLLPALLGIRGAPKKRWLIGAGVAAALAAGSLAFFKGTGTILPSLITVYQKTASAKFSPGFYALWRLLGQPRTMPGLHRITLVATGVFLFIAALASLLLLLRRMRAYSAGRLIVFAFLLLALGWLQPWYMLAALPFAVLAEDGGRMPDIIVLFAISAFAMANYAFGWGILSAMLLGMAVVSTAVFRPFLKPSLFAAIRPSGNKKME